MVVSRLHRCSVPWLVTVVCAATLLLRPRSVQAKCPNLCSGRGTCNIYSRCECYDGFQGGDCSERICPFGAAWSDEATDDDTAHADAECSNRGLCDRSSGQCECMDGYTGDACQRMSCDNDCNDNGVCISMRKFASQTYDSNSVQYVYESVWDADAVYGCVCDTGHYGYDCSLRACPTGDDPLTTGQVNEVQIFKCRASGGEFSFLWDGVASSTIGSNATAEQLKDALEAIPELRAVTITFSDGATSVCQTTSDNVVRVEFTHNFGSLPPLVPFTDDLNSGSTITVSADGSTSLTDGNSVTVTSVKGTKEGTHCSDRGFCDTAIGVCTCYDTNGDTYESSDGYGNAGDRGDCGYTLTTISNCPGEVSCSGHGVCNSADGTYKCDCSEGFMGGDCSEQVCEYGYSWFSYPSADDTAHDQLAECSDAGLCDRDTGECNCGTLFFGAACEYMACGGGAENPCNGNGKCLSMAKLAEIAEDNGDATDLTYGTDPNNAHTWDRDRIFGCHCDEGFFGYDCSLRLCPFGDDSGTHEDVPELQLLTCTGTDGTFTLSFRQQVTSSLSVDINATALERALEELSTIDDVTVEFTNGTTLCYSTGDPINVAKILYNGVHSDVPALIADTSSLVDRNADDTLGVVTVAQDGTTLEGLTSVTGTTESDECSNRGLCDRDDGSCSCFDGWASSDGQGASGVKRDCGYRVPKVTTQS